MLGHSEKRILNMTEVKIDIDAIKNADTRKAKLAEAARNFVAYFGTADGLEFVKETALKQIQNSNRLMTELPSHFAWQALAANEVFKSISAALPEKDFSLHTKFRTYAVNLLRSFSHSTAYRIVAEDDLREFFNTLDN